MILAGMIGDVTQVVGLMILPGAALSAVQRAEVRAAIARPFRRAAAALRPSSASATASAVAATAATTRPGARALAPVRARRAA